MEVFIYFDGVFFLFLLFIYLGCIKISGVDNDEVVYFIGWFVDVLNVWFVFVRIESGSVFWVIDCWGNVL